MSNLSVSEGESKSALKGGKGEASKPREIHYSANQIIGKGSFGIVYKASVLHSGKTVAIKKVLQDPRFKNRELQTMKTLKHPNVVTLKHYFYAKGDRKGEELYLNLVMEYIPETLHYVIKKYHVKMHSRIPSILLKCYMYQICRAIAYIHSLGICHRDIKPHNLLLNTRLNVCKLCDFGSAKSLVNGQPNVSYICSRYYRAPELVFEAVEYTTAIDVWSVGTVMAEMLLGKPIFLGQNRLDQLIEIVKILGTPTQQEIKQMNPDHKMYKFPQLKGQAWDAVFKNTKACKEAIELMSKFLIYVPTKRITCFEALAHPYFDDLRAANLKMPNDGTIPEMFNFTPEETAQAKKLGIWKKLQPQGP